MAQQVSITAKLRLRTTEEQGKALRNTCALYKDVCNYISDYIFKTHCMDFYDVNGALYHDIREKFHSKSQMTQSAIKTVIARYKTIIENHDEWTQVVFRHLQCDLTWNNDYSFVDGMLSVSTLLKGRLKVPFYNDHMEQFFVNSSRKLPENYDSDYRQQRASLPQKDLTQSRKKRKEKAAKEALPDPEDGWKFGTGKLVLKHGKWYFHVAVTGTFDSTQPVDVEQIVGIDMGINFLAVSVALDGKTTFYPGRYIKNIRARYKEVRRSLQKKGTPSARKRLQAIGSRENRWMEDVNHCLSKALVNAYPEKTLFVVEDLKGIRSATARVRKRDRYMQVGWAYYSLQSKLSYKASLHHSQMVKVDPHYTSQCCPMCGHTERSNRNKKTHTFCCKYCGYKTNDDRVASMNILQRGILSHVLPSGFFTVVDESTLAA